jgi:hypothetical protein
MTGYGGSLITLLTALVLLRLHCIHLVVHDEQAYATVA